MHALLRTPPSPPTRPRPPTHHSGDNQWGQLGRETTRFQTPAPVKGLSPWAGGPYMVVTSNSDPTSVCTLALNMQIDFTCCTSSATCYDPAKPNCMVQSGTCKACPTGFQYSAASGSCPVCEAGYGGSRCRKCTGRNYSGGGSLANCARCAAPQVVQNGNTACA
jgi:hypothetical protein